VVILIGTPKISRRNQRETPKIGRRNQQKQPILAEIYAFWREQHLAAAILKSIYSM
jgi:hypothetical protein